MNEQTSLNSEFHAEPDFKVYTGWILTVGELKKKLAVYNDHDQVRLDFRGKDALWGIDRCIHAYRVYW